MRKIIRFKTASSCCTDGLMKQVAELLGLGYKVSGPTGFIDKGNGIIAYIQTMAKEEPIKYRKIKDEYDNFKN